MGNEASSQRNNKAAEQTPQIVDDTKQLSLEKLAFLPAALEIQAAPPAKWSRSLLWFIMALLVIATIWACWAKIDIIATAQGKIVPLGQVKVIQPLETGVVNQIFVKEGQQVKAGDKLIALDNTANIADVERLNNEWQGYIDDLQRQQLFLQQLNNSQPSINKEAFFQEYQTTLTSQLNLQQRLLLNSSWQEYQSKLDSIDSEITKLFF